MRIAELAASTGVSPRLLRYYERVGLLRPARDERGWRDYDTADQARVAEIRELIQSGLPTAAIVQLLDTADGSPGPQVSDELRAELVAVRDRIDARVRCLARNRDALDAWLTALPPRVTRPNGSATS